MLRRWSDENGFGDDERRKERSRGGGLDRIGGTMTGGDEIGRKGIGSDATSSAQLRGRDGGEVIQTGSWIGSGCGDVCEPAS